jgi:hypothetical protein
MTDSTLHLNYWILRDYPHSSTVSLPPRHHTIPELKEQLIRENRVELRDDDIENLHIWNVSDLMSMAWHINAD